MGNAARLAFAAIVAATLVPVAAAAAPAAGSVRVTGYVPSVCRSSAISPSQVTCNTPGAFQLQMASVSADEGERRLVTVAPRL